MAHYTVDMFRKVNTQEGLRFQVVKQRAPFCGLNNQRLSLSSLQHSNLVSKLTFKVSHLFHVTIETEVPLTNMK
jgi:hypothetical protein